MEHITSIKVVGEELFTELHEEINRMGRISEGTPIICIDSISPDQASKLHDLLESGGIKLEALYLEMTPNIPDLSCMMDDYRYIEDRIPNKAKSVAKADGFNPPPMKGRKQRYHR